MAFGSAGEIARDIRHRQQVLRSGCRLPSAPPPASALPRPPGSAPDAAPAPPPAIPAPCAVTAERSGHPHAHVDRAAGRPCGPSDVRVHTDSTAHDLNHAVSARAFATGTDVYFAQDQYKPEHVGRRQADRARARARRPAARRADQRPADRLESRRLDGARGGRRGRQDRAVSGRAARPRSPSASSTAA